MLRSSQDRIRTRSAWLLSLILHLLVAMLYLFYPRDYQVQEVDSIPVEWVKDVPPPKLRKAELKPNIEKTVYKKERDIGRRARNKLARASSNDLTEVIRKSNRLVTRNVEIARADPSKVLPTISTDARLREADANVSRMVALKGAVDGDGEVTGRVRVKGQGEGLDLIDSYGDSTEGLLGGGGDPGVADRLEMIKYLNEQTGPQRVVYCLDVSASMAAAGLRKLDLAVNAIKDSIRMLRDIDRFNIVTFYGEARLMKRQMQSANLEAMTETFKYLNKFTPNSIRNNRGTDVLGALQLALKLEPTVVFLVTDGLPAPDPQFPDRVVVDTDTILTKVQEYNTSHAKIFVVGLEVDPEHSRNARLLLALADQNNGRIKLVDNDELVRYTRSMSQ